MPPASARDARRAPLDDEKEARPWSFERS